MAQGSEKAAAERAVASLQDEKLESRTAGLEQPELQPLPPSSPAGSRIQYDTAYGALASSIETAAYIVTRLVPFSVPPNRRLQTTLVLCGEAI